MEIADAIGVAAGGSCAAGVSLASVLVVAGAVSVGGAVTSEGVDVDVALLGPVEVMLAPFEVEFDALDAVVAA